MYGCILNKPKNSDNLTLQVVQIFDENFINVAVKTQGGKVKNY